MNRFDMWDKERLTIHELPAVRDLLERADMAQIADARTPMMQGRTECRQDEAPTMSEVRAETEMIVGNLLASPEKPTSGESLLIPSTCVLEDPIRLGAFIASTEAVLVYCEDLPCHGRRIVDPIAELSFEDSSDLSSDGWSYDALSWEEIMALPVYVPERFCEIELYQFIASVIEDATFYGTEQAESDEIPVGFIPELDEVIYQIERAKAEGDLERAYELRLSDLYERLMLAGRMERWQDCEDLAKKLT